MPVGIAKDTVRFFPQLHLRVLSVMATSHIWQICVITVGDVTMPANTLDPHEFDLNLPKALAEVRHDSWKQHAWPAGFSAFDRAGVLIAGLSVLVATVLFYTIANFEIGVGMGFMPISHTMFLLLSLRLCSYLSFALGISLRSYWHATVGGAIRLSDLRAAVASAAQMKNLKGGHGDGCNFEAEDAFTPWRRWFHHCTLYGSFCASRPLHRARCCTMSLIFRHHMAPLACQSCWACQVASRCALGHWVWAI